MTNTIFRLLAVVSVVLLLSVPVLATGYALHTVASGESLGSIATLYNVTVQSLKDENHLGSSTLQPGQVLKVPYVEAAGGIAGERPILPPSFRTHELQPGETLGSLAAKYGLSVEALVGANPDLSSLDELPVGLELLIPPGEGLVVTLDDDESVMDIIQTYGVSAVTIAKANAVTSPADLQPGRMLFLPGVKPTEALSRLAKVRAKEHTYVWPIHGRITSYYGTRDIWIAGSNFHTGIDVAAPWGTPIKAARSGEVIFAGWNSQGYGNLTEIRQADGSVAYYGHQSKLLVQTGEQVNQGEVIGRVGSTGFSTGPHLHFEVREHDRTGDPLALLH